MHSILVAMGYFLLAEQAEGPGEGANISIPQTVIALLSAILKHHVKND